jgi:hypothetical protein
MSNFIALEKISSFSRNLFTSSRSLLLPMLILALGLHAALLAMPLPSSEDQKIPDDKEKPIKVTQIPTEQPAPVPAEPNVKVPALAKTTVPATPTTPASDSSESYSSASSSNSSTSSAPSSSFPSKPANSSSGFASSTVSSTPGSPASNSGAAKVGSGSESAPGAVSSTTSEPGAKPSTTAIAPSGGSASTPFADFPHFQPSSSDCFGLGFGDNCRVVENGAIAQVTDFFRKELPAKEFKADLVTDEPTRKVFKISKDNKTLFLNIWQGKQNVSYLLAGVVYKQSPEEIKTEPGK